MSKTFCCRPSSARVYACLWLLWSGVVLGDTAEMLPAGISHLRYQFTSAEADRYFDSDGERRTLSAVYREKLEANGLSTEEPSIYHIETDGRFSQIRHDIYYEYGITSSLNFGFWTRYVERRLEYAATLTREAGWSSLPSYLQEAIEGAVTTADTAGDGSASSWGDTVLGIKHRPMGESNEDTFRFAYTVGVRLPTGHVADPLKPDDISVGDGQTDAGVWFAWDWEPNERWLLNVHTRHEYQFKGEKDEAYDTGAGKLSRSREFQPGFYHYVELFAHRRIPHRGINGFMALKAIYETEGAMRAQQYDPAAERYSGGLKAIDDTESMLFRLEPQIGFNLYSSGIPVSARLYYGLPLEGKNSLAVEYVGARFDVYW